MSDVVILGAGAVGLAAAFALGERGIRSTLLDPGRPGAAASSAAAGIVGAQIEAHGDGPMARLGIASRALFASLAERLRARTGLDVGYRVGGVLLVAGTAERLAEIVRGCAWQHAAGLRYEVLDGEAVRAVEGALADDLAGGVHFPDDGHVDPPALVAALRVAALRAGARVRSGACARRVLVESGKARGVVLEDGSVVHADRVVLAAGSWSALVEGTGLPANAVAPVRGQAIELVAGVPPIGNVVFGPGAYLSPRDDGRVVVGSTMEHVGFRPGVTAAAARDLLAGAVRLVPSLADAEVARTWSGLRPSTPDGLPLLGPSGIEGLVLATGHLRNGILLAPITGEIVAGVIAGERPPVDLAPFAPGRLAS